ncbi:RloB family protein [Acinetobacter modestus]|uniref:RloB family protein n=1 Tax=Acinetobacter modestus TaxID=1776740 RepID=UPI00320B9EC7
MGDMVAFQNSNFLINKNRENHYMSYRLSSKNPIDVRSSDSQTIQPKIKIFFVVEGAETESIYLNSFISKFEKNAIGDFIILDRLDRTKSHQKAVTKQIQDFLNSCSGLKDKQISILKNTKELLNNPQLDKKNLQKILNNLKKSKIPQSVLDLISIEKPNDRLLHLYALESIIVLKRYEKDFDKVCILIDRDKQSFKEEQYDDVIKICEENNFLLGISNPSFELFLFLHFSDLLGYDHEKILDNKKVSKSKSSPKFMEKLLKEYLQNNLSLSFNKNSFDADKFVLEFDKVPQNIISSNLSTCILELKNTIGTSVYNVLDPLIERVE